MQKKPTVTPYKPHLLLCSNLGGYHTELHYNT